MKGIIYDFNGTMFFDEAFQNKAAYPLLTFADKIYYTESTNFFRNCK